MYIIKENFYNFELYYHIKKAKMTKILTLFMILLFFYYQSYSNKLADNMEIINENNKLILKENKTDEFYNDDIIRSIYIEFEQDNWQNILALNYDKKADLIGKITVDGTVYDSVGIRYRGQTSYFKVTSDKKSFNISMDLIDEYQRIMGYKTLNLTNCYEDPSYMREIL